MNRMFIGLKTLGIFFNGVGPIVPSPLSLENSANSSHHHFEALPKLSTKLPKKITTADNFQIVSSRPISL